MDRQIKMDKHLLSSCVTEEQFKNIMALHKHYAKETDDVKLIRKAIKTCKVATFNNVADMMKPHFGVIKLRRLLDTYEDTEWKTVEAKHKGRGRPTKIYKRIK